MIQKRNVQMKQRVGHCDACHWVTMTRSSFGGIGSLIDLGRSVKTLLQPNSTKDESMNEFH